MLSNSISIFFYLFIYTLSSLLMLFYQRKDREIILLLSILVPSILAGFRYDVGTDYIEYLWFFLDLNDYSLIQTITMNSSLEIGFRILSKLLLIITSNTRIIFGILAFLTSFIYIKGYKNLFGKENIAIFYFVFLLTTFTGNLNVIRQGLAMSICFYGVYFLYKNDILKYVVLILIASTIHTSSLLALSLLLLKIPQLIDYIKKHAFLFLLLIVIILLSSFIILQGSLNIYYEKFLSYFNARVPGGEFSNTLDLLIIIIILLHIPQFRDGQQYSFLLKIIPFYLITILLGYQSVVFLRFKTLFVWVPKVMLVKFNKIYKETYLINFAIVTFYILFFILSYGVLGHSDIVPFKWR